MANILKELNINNLLELMRDPAARVRLLADPGLSSTAKIALQTLDPDNPKQVKTILDRHLPERDQDYIQTAYPPEKSRANTAEAGKPLMEPQQADLPQADPIDPDAARINIPEEALQASNGIPQPKPSKNRKNPQAQESALQSTMAQEKFTRDALNQEHILRKELAGQPTIAGSRTAEGANLSKEDTGRIPESIGPTLQTGVFQGGKIYSEPTAASMANKTGQNWTGTRAGGSTPHGNTLGVTDRGNFAGQNNFGIPEENREARSLERHYIYKLVDEERAKLETQAQTKNGDRQTQQQIEAENLKAEQETDAYGLQTTHKISLNR